MLAVGSGHDIGARRGATIHLVTAGAPELQVGIARDASQPDGTLRAFLATSWVRKLGLSSGECVQLKSSQRIGAAVLIAVPDEEGDHRQPTLRLDSLARQAMRLRVGAPVTVERATALPDAARIELRPPIDLFHDIDIGRGVRDVLAGSRAPIFEGALLRVAGVASGGSMVFEVAEIDGGSTKLARVHQDSDVVLLEPDEAAPRMADISLDDVGGLREEIGELIDLIQYPLLHPDVFRWLGIPAPRGVILHGPPGTGKTHLTRALASELSVELYLINGPELIGAGYGETEGRLRRLFSEASHHSPSIICIDELDAVAAERSRLGSTADVRAVSQLLTLMDGLRRVDGVVVIGTTNRLDAIDPAFRRAGRFDRELSIAPPDLDGRREILDIYTRYAPLTADARAQLDTLAARTDGYVGADLMELVREAMMSGIRRAERAGGSKLVDTLSLSAHDFDTAHTRVRPASARYEFVRQPSSDAPTLFGLDREVETLRTIGETILFGDKAVSRALGGCLISGPAGSGKSALVRHVASRLGVPTVLIAGGAIYSEWFGGTEATIRQLFDRARRLAPALLVIEALEVLVPRSGEDSSAIGRIQAQVMAELDDAPSDDRVMVVATTSRIKLVAPQLFEAGRFGVHLDVGYPDESSRRGLVQQLNRELSLGLGPQNTDLVVSATKGMSASGLRSVMAILALRIRRNSSDFGEVLTDALQRVDFRPLAGADVDERS